MVIRVSSANEVEASRPGEATRPAMSAPPVVDNPQIELSNVTKRFGRQLVLDHLSLAVEQGKCLVILGASGSGKSVMLKHMVGLLRPDSGEVFFAGVRIDNLPDARLMKI